MPAHLTAIRRALRARGLLHIGVKEGTGEARDSLGRRYTYFTLPEMEAMLRAAGFSPGPATRGEGPGLDGSVASFFTLSAVSDA